MQLHVARLCLDCEEVHDANVCPRCTSESFAFLSRWIPVPERRTRPRAEEAKPKSIVPPPQPAPVPSRARWVRRGAVLAALGLGGWLFTQKSSRPAHDNESAGPE